MANWEGARTHYKALDLDLDHNLTATATTVPTTTGKAAALRGLGCCECACQRPEQGRQLMEQVCWISVLGGAELLRRHCDWRRRIIRQGSCWAFPTASSDNSATRIGGSMRGEQSAVSISLPVPVCLLVPLSRLPLPHCVSRPSLPVAVPFSCLFLAHSVSSVMIWCCQARND